MAATAAATWMAEGKTSFDDCEALTWSLGWTSVPASRATEVITSLAFMLVDVPEPVWKTSMGNSASWSPTATSAAAAATAPATSASRTPSSPLTSAAAALIAPRAWISPRSTVSPETGKFSTARCVCAPQRAALGTRTSPIVSCSIRYSSSSAMAPVYRRISLSHPSRTITPLPLP